MFRHDFALNVNSATAHVGKQEVCMARLLHPLSNFALILALSAGVGLAVLLLNHSRFWSAPRAAEIPSSSGHTGGVPLLW
jgi:hypothetical protein